MAIESGSGTKVYTVAFHPDGVHFFGGTQDGIRRWRVADGQEAGKQTGMDPNAISVSRDGKWIVCGNTEGTSVWDAELLGNTVEVEDTNYVHAVDVSPESTRFATAAGMQVRKMSIWSITTGERLVGPLELDGEVKGIKFSPDSGRIAIACEDSIQIFDSYNGDQLITTKNLLPPPDWSAITPIVWPFDGRLFATSEGGKIKSFDTSTGSQVSEWKIHSHSSEDVISISPSANNRFIASFAGRSVSFWDTSTHTQLGGVLEDVDTIRSIALSPDGIHLATGGESKTVTIWDLRNVLPESYLPIIVSTTSLMLGRPMTLVYQSTYLLTLILPECEWSSLAVVDSTLSHPSCYFQIQNVSTHFVVW